MIHSRATSLFLLLSPACPINNCKQVLQAQNSFWKRAKYIFEWNTLLTKNTFLHKHFYKCVSPNDNSLKVNRPREKKQSRDQIFHLFLYITRYKKINQVEYSLLGDSGDYESTENHCKQAIRTPITQVSRRTLCLKQIFLSFFVHRKGQTGWKRCSCEMILGSVCLKNRGGEGSRDRFY